jgi:hypothetical protein
MIHSILLNAKLSPINFFYLTHPLQHCRADSKHERCHLHHESDQFCCCIIERKKADTITAAPRSFKHRRRMGENRVVRRRLPSNPLPPPPPPLPGHAFMTFTCTPKFAAQNGPKMGGGKFEKVSSSLTVQSKLTKLVSSAKIIE